MKVFFAPIPFCAEPSLWRTMWLESNQTRLHDIASHIEEVITTLDSVHSFMKEHRTEKREDADWVYFPVYFPLIFWYESEQSLQCVRSLFKAHDFGMKAGYDHIVNYGHEFPHWRGRSILLEKDYNETMKELRNISRTGNEVDYSDINNPNGFDLTVDYHRENRFSLVLDDYHLFAPNMFVIAVSHTKQGRYNFANQAGLFYLQRYIVTPYFASFNCDIALKKLLDFSSRGMQIMFVGGIKDSCKRINDTNHSSGTVITNNSEKNYEAHCYVFRERTYVVDAYQLDYLEDESIYVQPTPTDEHSRSSFRGLHDARVELYRNARFCLIMPGDGNTAQRLFHGMIQGCIPVFIYHKDSYVVLPFTAYIDWESLSLSYRVSSVEDTRAAIRNVLSISVEQGTKLQHKVIEAAPYISMELENCQPFGITNGAHYLLYKELEDRAYWRQRFLLPQQFYRELITEEKETWVQWGPRYFK